MPICASPRRPGTALAFRGGFLVGELELVENVLVAEELRGHGLGVRDHGLEAAGVSGRHIHHVGDGLTTCAFFLIICLQLRKIAINCYRIGARGRSSTRNTRLLPELLI